MAGDYQSSASLYLERMIKLKKIIKLKTFWPVVTSLLLMIGLLLLPTGYEGALSYQNADRVSARVLSTVKVDVLLVQAVLLQLLSNL